MEGCTDGSWRNEKTDKFIIFFKCPYGKGLYYPLNCLQLDARYAPAKALNGNRKPLSSFFAQKLQYIIDHPIPSHATIWLWLPQKLYGKNVLFKPKIVIPTASMTFGDTNLAD